MLLWMVLLAESDPNPWTVAAIVGPIGLAIGGLVTVLVKAVNDRESAKTNTRLQAAVAEAEEQRKQLDFLFEKTNGFVATLKAHAETIETELKEAMKKHLDCEVRLGRSEERSASQEKRIVELEQRIVELERRG